jgi:hypothetical protein
MYRWFSQTQMAKQPNCGNRREAGMTDPSKGERWSGASEVAQMSLAKPLLTTGVF